MLHVSHGEVMTAIPTGPEKTRNCHHKIGRALIGACLILASTAGPSNVPAAEKPDNPADTSESPLVPATRPISAAAERRLR
jgi:hypothetical protein